MEAPCAMNIPQKKLDFKFGNEKFCITLTYLTKLKISINCLERKKVYENEFSLDEITKINRYFLMCESIKDIYDELSGHINEETKIENGTNSLSLIIFLPCQKNREANFVLYIKKNSLEEEISYLNERINKQEKIIKEQNNRIMEQEKEIKVLKEKTSILENRLSIIENQMPKKEYTNSIYNVDENIRKLKQIIGRKCDLKLLYQMKKDGYSCSTFHEKVDNQGPTITLFESEDGYKFGGYTSKSFQTGCSWVKDRDSFLFNFINFRKFPIKKENLYAIFLGNSNDYGPEFYDILNNSSDIRQSQIRAEHYIYNISDLKGGGEEFKNSDVLVYKVIFF